MEPSDDYQQQTSKASKEVESESSPASAGGEMQVNSTSSADEEAVNKVAEKIDTLRMGPRQVKSSCRMHDRRFSYTRFLRKMKEEK